jgi:hypothetical protein
MINTASNLQIKNIVIATSLSTAILGSLTYEQLMVPTPVVNFKPMTMDPAWDITPLRSYNTSSHSSTRQDDHSLNELIGFANMMTKSSSEIDNNIRVVIEENFWDML